MPRLPALVLLLALGATGAATADDATFRAMNAICRQAIDRGDENRVSVCRRINFELGKLATGTTAHSESLINLGEIKAREGDYIDAAPFYQQALKLEETRDPRSLATAQVLERLADAKLQYSKFAESELYYRRAIEIRRLKSPKAAALGQDLVAHADLLAVLNDYETAAAEHREARNLLIGAGSAEGARRAQLHLAELYEVQVRSEPAYAEYAKLREMAEAAPRDVRLMARAEQRLGWMSELLHKPDQATRHYRAALALSKDPASDDKLITAVNERLAAMAIATPPSP